MTLAIGWLYVRFGGLAWMQAAFYGVGAAVIGIISLAAWKLARLTLAQDRLQWVIFAVMGVVTAWTESEIAALFVLAGGVASWPRLRPRGSAPASACLAVAATPELLGQLLGSSPRRARSSSAAGSPSCRFSTAGWCRNTAGSTISSSSTPWPSPC